MAVMGFFLFVFGYGLADDVVVFEEEDVVAEAVESLGVLWG